MSAIIAIIGVLAVVAWLVAVFSAFSLVGEAPAGSRLATLFDLGWLRFDRIESRIGANARTHISRYRKAFLAFFLMILAAAASAVALTSDAAIG